MCCLFGMIDYKNHFTRQEKNKIISILSTACEERGVDATGIAYNAHDKICIYKRPIEASKMKYRLPYGVKTIMGHTRMTTQGDEKLNYNNHPFYGKVDDVQFALAHNGVLRNDLHLRHKEKLPHTKIETDSYIAVQLIEKKKELSFDSLKFMAEQLEGSFTFTVLDGDNNLYFVKGDNPMCIYHYNDIGVYLYASTEEILRQAFKEISYKLGDFEKVNILCGEILTIDEKGCVSKEAFCTDKLYSYYHFPFHIWDDEPRKQRRSLSGCLRSYIAQLKSIASYFGYAPEYIDLLIDDGNSTDEIEEMLYCGEI